jgi:argininosuccinate synthase
MDRNLWHLSHEGSDLEDPWNEPKENVLMICTPPSKAPEEPEYVEIEFEKGIPVKVNGTAYDGVSLIKLLNEIGARHGVGIADMVENRLVGMKSRGVYETPGGTISCMLLIRNWSL